MSDFKSNNSSEFIAAGGLVHGYTVIPNQIMNDIPNITSDGFTVLAKIFQYINNPQHKISIQGLSTQTGLSKDRVSKALKKLIEAGYIIRTPKKRGNLIAGYLYQVYDKPQNETVENTTSCRNPGFQDTENQDTKNQDTKNQDTKIQDANKENNNKENNNKENINNTNTYTCVNEKLSSMSKLYQKNIGVANGIVGEWLIEVSEQIDVDLFRRAVEICTEKGNCNLGYLKGIIKKWLDVNITTLEQLKAYELQNRKQPTNSIPKQQQFIPHYNLPGENRVGVRVHETFRDYDPNELEKMLLESQKGKFD